MALPDIKWGDEPEEDWRKTLLGEFDQDDDDEELDKTPEDVIKSLQFDPLDLKESFYAR